MRRTQCGRISILKNRAPCREQSAENAIEISQCIERTQIEKQKNAEAFLEAEQYAHRIQEKHIEMIYEDDNINQ